MQFFKTRRIQIPCMLLYGRVPNLNGLAFDRVGLKIVHPMWTTPAKLHKILKHFIKTSILSVVFLIKKWVLRDLWFNFNTTLCGGSLGSRVDEERSKLRELMWFAGHIDHRYLERILRLWIASMTTPVWGSVLICKIVNSACTIVRSLN